MSLITDTATPNGAARNFLLAGALVAAIAWIYWPVRGFPFVDYDDNIYVYQNPHVLGGLTLDNVRWAFDGFHANFWHPLIWLSLMLDRTLFGPGPGGFHAMNVVYHAANALLLWTALLALTGANVRSYFAAAIWALHPLRVESVAWITERKDTLSGLFFMLTLLAYARYAKRPTRWRYAAVGGVFALGLMAKPMLVPLPLVLLLLDAWPLRRWRSRVDAWPLLLGKAPLLALAGIAAGMAFVAQDVGGALPELPLHLRTATALRAAIGYAGEWFWPAHLAIFYAYDKHPAPVAVLAAAGALIAITSGVIWQAKRRPFLVVGWGWYALSLLPVCGLIQVGGFSSADRFTYLPTIGLAVAFVWLIAEWAFLLPIAVALTWVSAAQVQTWRSTQVLFDHALAVTSDNWLAHYNVGQAELVEGNIGDARAHFGEAVRLKPAYGEAHDALAYTLRAAGDGEGALREYLAAARELPDLAMTRYNLAATLSEAGRLEAAALAFRCASRLDPAMTAAHEALGNTLLALDRAREAIPEYEAALCLDPANPRAAEGLRLARERDKSSGVRY